MEMDLSNFVTEQGWISVGEAPSLSSREPRTARSILDRVGRRNLCLIVWRSTPFPLRLISFSYGLAVYRELLATSTSLCELRALHMERYQSSRSFRLLRPRYHRVVKLLDSLGMAERVPVD